MEKKKQKKINFKPKMRCHLGHFVTNTTIDSFVNSGFGCFECNGNEPWTHRYEEFNENAKKETIN